MIASVGFRNYKALRATRVALAPFNVVIGPNGSGKTSLMEALLRLRALASMATFEQAHRTPAEPKSKPDGQPEHRYGPPADALLPSQVEVEFASPHAGLVAEIRPSADHRHDAFALRPADSPQWLAVRHDCASIRGYVLDHRAMAAPAPRKSGAELTRDGANVAAVLARIRDEAPHAFTALSAEMLRVTPEFRSVELAERADGRVELGLRLSDNGLVTPAEMSQGMLYLIAVLVLAFEPHPPRLLCIEDVDRGLHPRMLREVRDALYRLSYPESAGLNRRPVQVVVTTHSPYFIDLFRDHPEEVIVSHKHGRAAQFERLSDRADLPELLREGNLGDMWFSGILGGVPDEP